MILTEVLALTDGNFKHFKTFVGYSRIRMVGHCLTGSHLDIRQEGQGHFDNAYYCGVYCL